jgi:hypothetical protein
MPDPKPTGWRTRTKAANQKRKQTRTPPWREKKNPISTQHAKGVWFLSGKPPIEPLAKATDLGKIPGKVYLVALMARGIDRQDTVTPNLKQWGKFNVTRSQRHRGLKALEDAGLILVKRKAGSLPTITFLWQGDPELLDTTLEASDLTRNAILDAPVCDQTFEH